MSTATLTNVQAFNIACLETVGRAPVKASQRAWMDAVDELVAAADVIQLPSDAGKTGMLLEHVRAYVDGARAKTLAQAAVAGVYVDSGLQRPEHPLKSGALAYFKGKDLLGYLDGMKVQHDGPGAVYELLEQHRGYSKVLKVAGKSTRFWCVPLTPLYQDVNDAAMDGDLPVVADSTTEPF
jgi:hypothetical protein